MKSFQLSDPDAPSRTEPTNREFLHWLVGNIQGNNIKEAEVIHKKKKLLLIIL